MSSAGQEQEVVVRIDGGEFTLPRRAYRMLCYIVIHRFEIGEMGQGSLGFDFGGDSLQGKLTRSGPVTEAFK